MLARGRAHERVVDGAARHAQAGDLGAEGKRLIFAEEPRRGKVVGQEAESAGGRPTLCTGEPRQD